MGWKPPKQLGEEEDGGDTIINNDNAGNLFNDDSCEFFADGLDPFHIGEGTAATTKDVKRTNTDDEDGNNDWVSFPSTASGSSSEDDNENEDYGFSSYKKRNNIHLSTRNLRGRHSIITQNVTEAAPKPAASLIHNSKSPPTEGPKRLQSLPTRSRNDVHVDPDQWSSSVPKRMSSLDASTCSRRSRSRRRRASTDSSSGCSSHRRRVSSTAGSGNGQRRKASTDSNHRGPGVSSTVANQVNDRNRKNRATRGDGSHRERSSSRGSHSQVKASSRITDSMTTTSKPDSRRKTMTITTKDDVNSSESESTNNISSSTKTKRKNKQNFTATMDNKTQNSKDTRNDKKEGAEDLMSWLENMTLKNNAKSNNSPYSNSDNFSIGGNSIQSAPVATSMPKIHRSGRRNIATATARTSRHSSAVIAGSSLARSPDTTTTKSRRRKNKNAGESNLTSAGISTKDTNKSLSNNLPFRSPTSVVSNSETLSLDVAELVEKGLIHVGDDGKLKLVIDLPGANGAE